MKILLPLNDVLVDLKAKLMWHELECEFSAISKYEGLDGGFFRGRSEGLVAL